MSNNKIILKSHATIIEVPRRYGFEFAKKQIEFPKNSEILDFFPRIHDSQKTETINVDDILEIQEKVRGRNSKEQFIVFHGSEKMTEPAQAKFLKLLEEPRENLRFVLLTNSVDAFLSTIRSRSQNARILPISEIESLQILKKFKLDDIKTRQILFLAKGLPEELSRLAKEKKYFNSKLEVVNLAKTWISGDEFEKLIIINSLKKDREKALDLIEQILRILQVSTNGNYATKIMPEIKKLLKAYSQIENNGNVRLSLIPAILK